MNLIGYCLTQVSFMVLQLFVCSFFLISHLLQCIINPLITIYGSEYTKTPGIIFLSSISSTVIQCIELIYHHLQNILLVGGSVATFQMCCYASTMELPSVNQMVCCCQLSVVCCQMGAIQNVPSLWQ